MCGISGIFSLDPIIQIEKRIIKMNDSLKHRGPDSGGYHLFTGFKAIAHRRLSIIDLHECANQPMESNTKLWNLVFNGEIYNFEELKAELSYDFKTNSDTEVIIAAFEEKGINWFLERANGMFAIAIYNSGSQELYLLRDRLGIKPLFYFYDGQKLVFSSEIKAILSSGLVKAEFNELAVDEYLGNRYVREPYTFFKNIRQVRAGSYLKFDKSLEKTECKYWRLPEAFNRNSDYNEEEVAELFETQLLKAIRYRLIADVPLGTYLSGGVDSSLITAIAKKYKKGMLNSYTIGFPELNEFKYAQMVAKQHQTDHHEILIKKDDYVNNWERLIALKDAPLGVPNEIPLAIMSQKLKEKITVVLSGEGADELMGGYGRIFRSPFDFQNDDQDKSFYDYFIDQYEYVSRDARDKFLTTPKTYREEFDSKLIHEFDNKPNEENVFRFFHNYHVKGLLQRVDMTTMQTSVEARVPFLDHELIEYAYTQVPYDLKLKWKSKEAELKAGGILSKDYSEVLDVPKYLLRKIGYSYLPETIIERKKVGFPVPLTEWFSNLEELARELLPGVSWLKKSSMNELLLMSKNDVRAGQVLWMFLNIAFFEKQYFQKDWEW